MKNKDNDTTQDTSLGFDEYSSGDEVELRELMHVVWRGKRIIAVTTLSFIILAIVYALNLPDIYKSEALLSPVSADSSLKIPGQLGGLAALAGVSLASGNNDKIGLATEIIKSREFIGKFIEQNDLYIPIMAAEGWSRDSNRLLIDKNVYDETAREWVRKVSSPYLPKPSTLETYDEFMKNFSIVQDKNTGMVTISVEHYSPYLSQHWVELLVKSINKEMRTRDLREAQKSIEYLSAQIEKTNIADVRTTLYSLIEEQTKTLMLANVRDEYVFKTIDPAVVAEKKSKPKRALIVILMSLLGAILATFGLLLRHYNRKSISNRM